MAAHRLIVSLQTIYAPATRAAITSVGKEAIFVGHSHDGGKRQIASPASSESRCNCSSLFCLRCRIKRKHGSGCPCSGCREFSSSASAVGDPFAESKRKKVEAEVQNLTKHEAEDFAETWDEAASAASSSKDSNNYSYDNLHKEHGGPKGPEPTRFGDWEQKGRCSDF